MHDRRVSVAKHGLRYRFNGLPIYAEDPWSGESVITGVIYEPRWTESDLTKRHQREIDALVAEHLAARPQDDPLDVRYLVLNINGIEHLHRQGKPMLDYRPAYGYECAMCHAYIVAKDPGDAPFYGGPWNGRWVVTGGALTWRVPIPTAITAAAFPDDPVDMSVSVVEYRRGRDGAYYIDRQSYPTD